MYSAVRRDEKYIRNLFDFIKREYNLEPLGIAPAKRGFFGETWKLETENGCYFIKLDYSGKHKFIYERSFRVIEHLNNSGIDFISGIVKTAECGLSSRYDGAVMGVFDWINGENIESYETKPMEFQMLAKVYAVSAERVPIPREDFSGQSARGFFAQWDALECPQVKALLEKYRGRLEHRANRLKHFAGLCQGDDSGFFITHGDAGGNIIIDGSGYYIVDWDDPQLAPPERDGWNMLCLTDWAECLFNKTLRENGINYIIRQERTAYYCYHSYFFYLTEFLDALSQPGVLRELENYFEGWVEERADFADKTLK